MADAPRRARIKKGTDGLWMVIVTERVSIDNMSPRTATFPLFYKRLPTWAAALAWAISALEEFYLPDPHFGLMD